MGERGGLLGLTNAPPAVAVLEICGGLMLMGGLLTRFFSIPFVVSRRLHPRRGAVPAHAEVKRNCHGLRGVEVPHHMV